MSDAPPSKDEEDFALCRMPVFDLGAEAAKMTKAYIEGGISMLKITPAEFYTKPIEHQPSDWIWEKEVDLGWLGESCVQIYGRINPDPSDGNSIDDLRIMLGNNDITNQVPEKVIVELINEIFEERVNED